MSPLPSSAVEKSHVKDANVNSIQVAQNTVTRSADPAAQNRNSLVTRIYLTCPHQATCSLVFMCLLIRY